MNGIELAREYYLKFGKPMIDEKFPLLKNYIAAGICGQGSECLGYDDEISRDHDFEPGFIIFLPGEDIVDRRQAFLLERAYNALPKEFCGVRRLKVAPVGGSRRGVTRISDFFEKTVGSKDGALSTERWLTVPDFMLCEAINGEIFFDGYGEVTRIRAALSDMPEDAMKKRLAGRLLAMAQSGQYNYPRCLAHGETAAAQLSVCEFSRRALEAIFLLNRRPMPFYKWAFRALADLTNNFGAAEKIEFLLSSGNDPFTAAKKTAVIEELCSSVAKEIETKGIAPFDRELERLAYAVNDSIKDTAVRSLSVFCTVQ